MSLGEDKKKKEKNLTLENTDLDSSWLRLPSWGVTPLPVCEWTQVLSPTALQGVPTQLLGGTGCWEQKWLSLLRPFMKEKTEAWEARPASYSPQHTHQRPHLEPHPWILCTELFYPNREQSQINPNLALVFPLNSFYWRLCIEYTNNYKNAI